MSYIQQTLHNPTLQGTLRSVYSLQKLLDNQVMLSMANYNDTIVVNVPLTMISGQFELADFSDSTQPTNL